jgi:hypothetical protein
LGLVAHDSRLGGSGCSVGGTDGLRSVALAVREKAPLRPQGDWCTNCKAFQERTVQDEQLRSALQKAVLLKIYDTSVLFSTYRDDPRFPELRVGLPFFVITDAKGELLYKTSDFTKTDEMSPFFSDI